MVEPELMGSPAYAAPYYSPEPRYYYDDTEIGREEDDSSPRGNNGRPNQLVGDSGSDDHTPGMQVERQQRPSSFAGDMTVEHTAAFDCGICFLPLKPPIYQCNVGHVLCSTCRGKLATANKCHVCRGTTSFRRCFAMEQVVDSVRVPCPHAIHGCVFRPAYHSGNAHAQACAYTPRRCPGMSCGFVGSTAALLEHFADTHGWPCTAESFTGCSFPLHLRDGFNFITAVRENSPDQEGTTTTEYMFLLNVVQAPFGRAISAICFHPRASTTNSSPSPPAMECKLELSFSYYKSDRSSHRQRHVHSQTSRFEVQCMDPSRSELPDPKVSFQFVIPKHIVDLDVDAACKVMAAITISQS